MDVKKISETMGPFFETLARDVAAVIQKLGLSPAADILDVGTGDGYSAIILAASGYKVLTGEPATDDSRYAGKNWQERAEKVGVLDRIRSMPFAAEDMPFPDGSFDAVFFFGVLHHIEESLRRETFREAMRVTKDKGTVVFFEPTKEMLPKILLKDPEHPAAACPADYASEFKKCEARLPGTFMDAFIFTKS